MLDSLLFTQSALQAVVVIFLIIVSGLLLGRVRIAGISLGVTFVFFCGILAGHLGLSINPHMLAFAQNFGLIIFVYALGLQVGPGFFNAFRKGGMELNVLGMGVIALGTVMAVAFSYVTEVSLPDMIGILCGATTNTPALGAAQQTLDQLGMDSASPALGCAVTYPLGVVGVILAMILLRKTIVKPVDLENRRGRSEMTYIATYRVLNPAIIGKSLLEIGHLTPDHFIVSRVWREGKLILPDSSTTLLENDRILTVTTAREASELTLVFGELEQTDWNREGIDWDALDAQLSSHRIIVTQARINGKSLGSLRLRNRFSVNVTRIYRAGMALLATPDRILRLGDEVVVVGSEEGKGTGECRQVAAGTESGFHQYRYPVRLVAGSDSYHPSGNQRSCQTGPGRRTDHCRYLDGGFRAADPYGGLYDRERQPDAPPAGPGHVPGLPGPGCRRPFLRNRVPPGRPAPLRWSPSWSWAGCP